MIGSPTHQAARQRLLSMLSPRQIEVGEAYVDGFSAPEIAERLSSPDKPFTITDVRRELYQIERACRLVGARLPRQEEIAPSRLLAHDESQLSDGLYRQL